MSSISIIKNNNSSSNDSTNNGKSSSSSSTSTSTSLTTSPILSSSNKPKAKVTISSYNPNPVVNDSTAATLIVNGNNNSTPASNSESINGSDSSSSNNSSSNSNNSNNNNSNGNGNGNSSNIGNGSKGSDDNNNNNNSSKKSKDRLVDDSLLCPICLDIIKEPFITKCGHSFCYQCITPHLSKSNTCPMCMGFLTREQIIPNFALSKFVEKMTAQNNRFSIGPPAKKFRNSINNEDLSINEINIIVSTLLEKKKHLELQDQQVEYDVLLDFLCKTRQQKMEVFKQLKRQISYLDNDIKAVDYYKQISEKKNETSNSNNNNNNGLDLKMSSNEIETTNLKTSSQNINTSLSSSSTSTTTTTTTSTKKLNGSTTTTQPSQQNIIANKKKRVETHLEDLQSCYFSAYKEIESEQQQPLHNSIDNLDTNSLSFSSTSIDNNNNNAMINYSNGNVNHHIENVKMGKGLLNFSKNLLKFTRYNEFKVIATLKYGDLYNTSSIVSSIEFDRDDEFFATAGVTKKIKIFEYAQIRDNVEVHSPTREMTCRSKISCLSWNTYIKSQIASSDYEGIISLWDANTGQNVMLLEEHEKRVWSVDFSRADPTLLASGSDDTKVKLWSTSSDRAVTTIESKANICCVKFNPNSSNLIAFGSADHHIHYYDLRQHKEPLFIFKGHRKAVSYVKFINKDEIISASTDSTLKLWDVNQNDCIRTFTGHSNEKNFVGLTVNGDYICCGSENNGVYTYYKTLSKPIVTHKFGTNSGTGEETDDDGSQFVSSVCWKKDSNILLAANSQGNIKVLELF
ncbi:hypothetical protein CYY_006777 [Polysphondylium violaceum]|uniref:RING-type domain-containing protein n=1 Tax=Polysphondylium violaceum TaxID=133409 RepID=A0A8J4PQ23_9MYCE|nr:hypothetical protein CYY_006777 [Polysphondylium violaceum]